MRNNGKKRTTILVAALLALVMTLSLTACQVEIPGVGTININGGNTPTGGQVPGGNGTGGDERGGATTILWICCGRSWMSVTRTSASRWPISAISTAVCVIWRFRCGIG